MEQLIFFAIIIFFSIIESVARSRKQKKGGPLPEVPPEWEWEEQKRSRPAPRGQKRTLPPPDEVPSFDGEPSFDTRATSDDEKAREALEQKRSRSSESMIPTEIWDEIAGLTREPSRQEPGHTPPPRPQLPRAPVPHPKRAPTPPRPAPKVEPRRTPSPTPAKSAPKRATILTPEPTPGRVPAHAVHASHAGYGTDPSARAPTAQDNLDPLARVLGADASAVRVQLRSNGAHALRQAFILHEVLGPPAADREDRF